MIASLILASGCASYSLEESTLTSIELGNSIELTVPASKVKMVLPRLEFVKQENDANSHRYFYYWDIKAQLGISGWFEPATLFKGRETHWQQFLRKWPGNKPVNVRFEEVNEWQIVRYDIDVQGCLQSNAKGFLIQNETWLEIYVSSFCKKDSSKADVIDLIKMIIVEDKM